MLFFKRKINKIEFVFLSSLRKKSAVPLSLSAFPVYVGNWVEVLWRQKTFWNVEKMFHANLVNCFETSKFEH